MAATEITPQERAEQIKQELTPQQACEVMRCAGFKMSLEKLYLGISQGVYPFGDYVAADGKLMKHDCYTVYKVLLQKWIAAHSQHTERSMENA